MSDVMSVKGNWVGTYRYSSSPDAGDFHFKARITQKGDVLTGVILEENLHGRGRTQADIAGKVDGRSMQFSKDYRKTGEEYRFTVDYSGDISRDGMRVSGTWKLPHDSGTFSMVRVL